MSSLCYSPAQLELSQSNVNALLEETRAAAEEYRLAAQELSLQRHALADELSNLTRNLVSSLSDADAQPTLLEDIETMHRNLKELNHVRSYVQVIEYALRLRYAPFLSINHWSHHTLVQLPWSKYRPRHRPSQRIRYPTIKNYTTLQPGYPKRVRRSKEMASNLSISSIS